MADAAILTAPDAPPARPARRPLTAVLDFLSSVWWGVALLATALVYMSVGSALPALRQFFELSEMQWFQTPILNGLIALFVLSVILVTVRRIPLNRYKVGVWMVHGGLVLMSAGAVLYFGYKIEGDIEIPRRAAVIRVPGAEAVRLPAIAGLPPVTVDAPDGRWSFEVTAINPLYQPRNTEILAALGPTGRSTLFQVNLSVTRPDGRTYQRSLLDGFERFNEDFTDQGRLVKQTGQTRLDPALQADLVLDPMDHFYLRDSAALYVQLPGMPPNEWLDRPLTGKLPYYREAYDPAWSVSVPAGQAIELPWYRSPLAMFAVVVIVAALAAVLVSQLLPTFRPQVWLGHGVLAVVAIIALGYAWGESAAPMILNHGPLSIPVKSPGQGVEVRVTGYLPYALRREDRMDLATLTTTQRAAFPDVQIVPRVLRERLADVARTRSLMRVEISRADWKTTAWLPHCEHLHLFRDFLTHTVDVPGVGPVKLLYGRERLPLPAPLALDEFIHEQGVGQQTDTDFVSVLVVGKPGEATFTPAASGRTQLNNPYVDEHYHYFQARYRPGQLSSTTLLVANRFGMVTMAAGIVLMLAGMGWAFYVKPVLQRRAVAAALARKAGGNP